MTIFDKKSNTIFNKQSIFDKNSSNNENVFKNKSKSYAVYGAGSFYTGPTYYGTATATATASGSASASATSSVSQADADRLALEAARKAAYNAALNNLFL